MFSEIKKIIAEYEGLPKSVKGIQAVKASYLQKMANATKPMSSVDIVSTDDVYEAIVDNPGISQVRLCKLLNRKNLSWQIKKLLKCKVIVIEASASYATAPKSYWAV